METVSEFLSNWTTTEADHSLDDLLLPENLSIGGEMKEFMLELQSHGRSLVSTLETLSIDSDAHNLLKKYVQEIGKQSCQIAVIGQMKAGKSSFINALIGHENLLPSDVNPWTTVVTRLHFGGVDLPDAGAEFSFFDENQWQRLAQGDTKLRSLVERFLPGFETDRLSKQLEEMRSQAERRLGSQFHELLGHSHWFEHINPNILKRYVCAGATWSKDEEQSDVGRFSDITETADVYFDLFPFAHPTTITDTPGTNDPFFVRDEITFRNLENADIFIVVLTAQQAFSISDLALLRILQGLQKDRIIVFINRIDQLDDWKRDSKEIISHVRYMLQREFPSVQFPVIAGSALWGKMALKKEADNDFSNSMKTLSAYSGTSDTITVDSGEILTKEQARSELFACSGMPDVASTISKLMLLKGKSHGSVVKIASTLKLTADSLLAVMKNKMLSLQSEMKRLGAGAQFDNDTEAVDKKLIQLQELISKCNNLQIQHEKKLDYLQQSILDCFRAKLNEIVVEFAKSECEGLTASMKTGTRNKVWRCNTTKVRQSLEDEFLIICQEATMHIDNMQSAAIEDLKKILQIVAPQINTDFLDFKEISAGEPYLSTLALKHTLALDLDQSWWKLWAQKHTPDHWAKELDKLIKSEFFPMVERLVQSAKAELRQRIEDSATNLSTMIQSVNKIMQEKLKKYKKLSRTKIFDTNQPNEASTNFDKWPELEKEFLAMQKNVSNIETISKQLKSIVSRHRDYLDNERQLTRTRKSRPQA